MHDEGTAAVSTSQPPPTGVNLPPPEEAEASSTAIPSTDASTATNEPQRDEEPFGVYLDLFGDDDAETESKAVGQPESQPSVPPQTEIPKQPENAPPQNLSDRERFVRKLFQVRRKKELPQRII